MKEKVLYISNDNYNDEYIIVDGLKVPKCYFQMFTLFLSEKVYQCPIRYEIIDDEEE